MQPFLLFLTINRLIFSCSQVKTRSTDTLYRNDEIYRTPGTYFSRSFFVRSGALVFEFHSHFFHFHFGVRCSVIEEKMKFVLYVLRWFDQITV